MIVIFFVLNIATCMQTTHLKTSTGARMNIGAFCYNNMGINLGICLGQHGAMRFDYSTFQQLKKCCQMSIISQEAHPLVVRRLGKRIDWETQRFNLWHTHPHSWIDRQWDRLLLNAACPTEQLKDGSDNKMNNMKTSVEPLQRSDHKFPWGTSEISRQSFSRRTTKS